MNATPRRSQSERTDQLRPMLDGLLERLAGQGIEHEPIETYSNGVRHVKIPDPDRNAIAFAEPPDAHD